MSMQTRGNQGYMLSRIVSPEEGEPETMKLCAKILGHPEPPSIYSYLATLEMREALEGMVDDYPGAAGYVLGYCTDSQLYEGRIRSFPKERWAILGKVARDLFGDGLDTSNWDRFTKTLAPRTYSITRWHHRDYGVHLGQVFNLAAQTRCPESIDVGYLYQEARWIEGMLAGFIIIEDLDPPEERRHKDAVRPLARRNLNKIVSAVFAETAARQVPEGENCEPAVQVTSRHWRGPAERLAVERAYQGTELGDQELQELIRETDVDSS